MAAEGSPIIVRGANEEDLQAGTRLVVLEDWHVNPQDFASAYAFDPSGFFVGELDGEIVSCINAVKYPGHSAFIGELVVQKEQRGKGYGILISEAAWRSLDHSCTIGLDGAPNMIAKYEAHGFQSVWTTSLATVDLVVIMKVLRDITVPSGVSVKPIRTVNFEKLFKYDTDVFGTPRRTLLQRYVNLPGSLGWAAIDEKGDIIGYNLVKHVITGAGTDFGLSMTPLYADNDLIARVLMKVAAETYLANDAVPASCFELYYSHGGSCGDHASRLVSELKAKTVNVGQRMYTKGIPRGRQTDKIYSSASPDFD